MAQPPPSRPAVARSPSVTTYTTRNGCTFDDMLDGKPGYCCEPSRLTEQKSSTSVDERVKMLTKNIEDTINEFAIQDKEVESFSIAKTYVSRHVKKTSFDPMNPNTWKKDGISKIWARYRDMEYDALIVLSVFTKETVPSEYNPEDYTIMLKQKLFDYYKDDERIQSETSDERHTGVLNKGYALCLAIQLEIDIC